MKIESNSVKSVKVKICGIRTVEDVEILNNCLPDFAGFVLAPSKRRVDMETLESLLAKLDRRITPVGVFVNEEHDAILKAIEVGIKIVQLHGDETPDYIDELKLKINELKLRIEDKNVLIWKALRIGEDNFNNQSFDLGSVDAVVLDKYSKQQFGGTGETFNWEAARNIKLPYPIILAGGLNVNNVEEGMNIVNPACVDVSSGVEENNKKDKELIKKFIENVRKED